MLYQEYETKENLKTLIAQCSVYIKILTSRFISMNLGVRQLKAINLNISLGAIHSVMYNQRRKDSE